MSLNWQRAGYEVTYRRNLKSNTTHCVKIVELRNKSAVIKFADGHLKTVGRIALSRWKDESEIPATELPSALISRYRQRFEDEDAPPERCIYEVREALELLDLTVSDIRGQIEKIESTLARPAKS